MIFLQSEQGINPMYLQKLAMKKNLVSHCQANMTLVMTPERLELRKRDEPRLGGIFVDFLAETLNFRRKKGGGRKEALARAIGIKDHFIPSVIDTTAGLGRDAFILASLGCRVRMFERHPVVALLLEDGLQRAYASTELAHWLPDHLTLRYISSLTALTQLDIIPDVVYLDPMFPYKKKAH